MLINYPNNEFVDHSQFDHPWISFEMLNKLAIGIDLGTTNSAIGIWINERIEFVKNAEGNF